jgi:hypothetical protein
MVGIIEMTKQTIQPHLKPKPAQIIYQLYRFRYLSRLHIQTLLHHKHHSRITTWLNELTTNASITMFYQKSFAALPAVYSLGVNGRKYLKGNQETFPDVKPKLLDRAWRESERSQEFRERCLLLADIYLTLTALVKATNATLHFYTQTDLHDTKFLILPNPWAYFVIDEANGTVKRYFLEIFDDRPVSFARKRVSQYFTYFSDRFWQNHTDKSFPEIILVCPTKRVLSHLQHVIEKKLDREPEILFYLSTWDEIKQKGLNRDTLHKVEARE